MRLSEAALLGRAGAALAMLIAAVPGSAAQPGISPSASGQLDAVRQECIAAAGDARRREQAVAATEHAIDLLDRDAEGRQRDLDQSRAEQEHLLGALLDVARNPPEHPAFAPAGTTARMRGEALLQDTLPGLRAEARALVGEIAQIGTLRRQIATQQSELAGARAALGSIREHLAELTARRREVTDRLLPEDSGAEARIAKLGHEANDIGDLIRRADAAAERRDKAVLARARAALPAGKGSASTPAAADPTRPTQPRAFDPPHSLLEMPVSGTIARRFGAADAAGTATQGLGLAALPGAEAVAPFDGRVVYAGPFGNLGLVLIIRHGGLYHSLLAGLGRIDIKAGEWVLADEPVGAMPEVSGAALYFELRRDDRPVDPEPWLAIGGARRNEPDADKKVRE